MKEKKATTAELQAKHKATLKKVKTAQVHHASAIQMGKVRFKQAAGDPTCMHMDDFMRAFPASDDTRQETGEKRQEAEQETGKRRKETGDRRQQTGRKDTQERRQETGDRR